MKSKEQYKQINRIEINKIDIENRLMVARGKGDWETG